MKSICGCDCEECELYKGKKCKGCAKTNGCPFGKKCWIADYIEIGNKKSFDEFKKQLISEFNSLNIDGLKRVSELYALHGNFVNLEYSLPNGKKVKFLNDDEVYLGNQIECEFDKTICFGLVANMNFILVCQYSEGGNNPELIIYKKR